MSLLSSITKFVVSPTWWLLDKLFFHEGEAAQKIANPNSNYKIDDESTWLATWKCTSGDVSGSYTGQYIINYNLYTTGMCEIIETKICGCDRWRSSPENLSSFNFCRYCGNKLEIKQEIKVI